MKTFVVGDIHGAYKALKQCLRRIKFDYDNDRLICLGDIVDGWPDTPKCIEELLKIKNLVFVLGNHDIWAMNWFETGARPLIWTEQGGQATIDAYIKSPELMIKHRSFFKNTRKYFVDEGNRIYVHGGFNPEIDIDKQHIDFVTWDRTFYCLMDSKIIIKPYTEAFIGHTSTTGSSDKPFCKNKVWFMDQGAGWEGKLTMMNVETKEYCQSDKVSNLYKNIKGR